MRARRRRASPAGGRARSRHPRRLLLRRRRGPPFSAPPPRHPSTRISYTAVSLGAFLASPAIHHSSWPHVVASARRSSRRVSASRGGMTLSTSANGRSGTTSLSDSTAHGLHAASGPPIRTLATGPLVDLSFERALCDHRKVHAMASARTSTAPAKALRRTRPRGIAAREEESSLRILGTRQICSRAPPIETWIPRGIRCP